MEEEFHSDTATLTRLEAEARAQIALLAPPRGWDTGTAVDLDVAIIGAGQSGIGLGFALNRAGVSRFAVFDAAAQGQAGIWATTARMRTLRTEKTISGIEQGIPALGFQHWFQRQWGDAAYDRLGRIPRGLWKSYLEWFQRVIDVNPRFEHRLIDVKPHPAGLVVTFDTPRGQINVTTRRLVLATGVDGFGAPFIPAVLQQALSPDHLAHTADSIAFTSLKGARVVVVGAASSAFDAAATALEAGAQSVQLLSRAAKIAGQSPEALARNPLLYRPFRDLSDAQKWQIITHGRARGHAPEATILRATQHAGFKLHLNAEIAAASETGSGVALRLVDGRQIEADFVIAGTGYRSDPALRPELARVAPQVRLWRDLQDLHATEADLAEWGGFPWLDRDLALVPRDEAGAWTQRIHIYNYGAVLSHGYHVGDIGSHETCVRRLSEALQDRLFQDTAAALLRPILGPQSNVAPLRSAPRSAAHAVSA